MKKNMMGLLLFLAIQLSFYAVSVYFFYRRPLIMLEWLLPFLFLFWHLRLGFILSTFVVVALDAMLGLTQIYMLIKPTQWLHMLKYIQFLNSVLLILIVCGIVLFFVWIVTTIRVLSTQSKFNGIWVAFSIIVLINFIPQYNGFANEDYKLYQQRGIRVLGSGILMLDRFNFEMDLGLSQGPVGGNDTAPWPHITASDYLKKTGFEEKVLFVVVESLGQSKNPLITNKILEPLILSKGVTVKFKGQVKFTGGTVEGELRELCHFRGKLVEMDYIQSKSNDCLPQYFKKLGYKTSAFHGASGVMYDRELWYPMLGFDDIYFNQSQNWPISRCYSFAGWCDMELISYVWQSLQNSDKHFTYWLTLNSHFPYSEKDVTLKQLGDECLSIGLGGNVTLECRSYILEKQLMIRLAEYIDKRPIKGLTIVLVGDHKTVFMQEHGRQLYSDEDVPVLILQIN